MADIDATARVAAGATIGAEVSIGPYCIVGPNVTLAEGCRLIAHVHIDGHTTIGPRTILSPFVSLGGAPQSVAYRGEPTRLVVGADCDIREGVTMNRGTENGGGVTEVGDRGFFMANSHVAHDCHVGTNVTFANCATLGGHCHVGDGVVIGGLSAVHQFMRIGSFAMIGGGSCVRGDVIPFGLAAGAYAVLGGLNIVGMRRQKFPGARIHTIRKAYRELFFGPGYFADRVTKVEAEFRNDEAVAQIVAFIRVGERNPLCHPGSIHGG